VVIKETTVFQTSVAFKEALAAYAQAHDISVADVVRTAVAAHIDYDIASEPPSERVRKYATKAERDKEMRRRAKERRDNERAIVEAVRRGERIEAIQAMAASLKGKVIAE
jgi:hypothetical protein